MNKKFTEEQLLLFEIALGIFGNKFYDIDGVPRSLSLHEQSYEQEEDCSNEPHLSQWLESDEETGDDKSNDIEDDAIIDLNLKDNATNKSSTKNLAASKEFNKLINHERAKLREQIRRNSAAYLLNWPSASKKLKSLKALEEGVISEFKRTEIDLLHQELLVLTEFRKSAEQKLSALDAQVFEQYKKTFITSDFSN